MLRKLTVLLMAALFSVSVAGLSFAQEKPKDPCAQTTKKKPTKKEKKAQKLAEKTACLEKATTDQAKAECEKKFAEKAKKKVAKKKMGEVPGPVEK